MKLKPLLKLLTFLGAELLSSFLGMLCIDSCSPRPVAVKKPGISTPVSTVRESSKPVFGNILQGPFFTSSSQETSDPGPAEIMAAA